MQTGLWFLPVSALKYVMPELPEVETVRQGLIQPLTGKTMIAIDQRRPDLRMPFPADLAKRLKGRRIERLDRRAKYILMRLDDGNILVLHLGMSGRITVISPKSAHTPQKHDHLIVTVDDGAKMIFTDPRRFGMVLLLNENELTAHPSFKTLGVEPLGDDFTPAILSAKLKGKKTPIKSALLDQKTVAGLGNIYVCEALYQAGIDPRRSAASLNKSEIAKLVPAIKDVLNRAIAAGGSSLKDYRTANGSMGYFQHGFAVYDREGQPCPSCKKKSTIKRIAQAGRSTFYCPRCQK
jgi:formamidopyrimidine-DNA glycosylase